MTICESWFEGLDQSVLKPYNTNMNTATKDMYSGLVLLFNTCADSSRAARLHAAGCPMVNTSKGGGKVKASTNPADIAVEVADLESRGWPVKRCKCCRRGP